MNYLYRYLPLIEVTDPENPPVQPHRPQKNSAYVATLASLEDVYLLPNEDPDGLLAGHWDNDGSLAVVDMLAYEQLRPLGNDAGVATDALDLMHYQGHAQRHLQDVPAPDTMPEYPADTQPFSLRITRTLTTDDSWPHIPWGWTVEMLSDDPLRDITARAIGVYDENDNYLYTTGSFILMDFDEFDGEGNPIVVQRYGTICPVGQRQADASPVYFKLLLGSAPEGAWVLEGLGEGDTQTRLFWSGDQPSTGGESWVDSGQTVTGMAGTVTLIQDNTDFPVGTLVRIDDVEMEVTSLWTGTGLVLDPYTASDTGAVVEIWQ